MLAQAETDPGVSNQRGSSRERSELRHIAHENRRTWSNTHGQYVWFNMVAGKNLSEEAGRPEDYQKTGEKRMDGWMRRLASPWEEHDQRRL